MPHIDVNGCQLWVEDTGDTGKPAILFSHSLFFDHTMFHHQRDELARDYRVVSYDHRGQGQSSPAARAAQSMDKLTEDAAALIESLDLAPCHVVGNSMGGFIALRLAARYPDLIASAVPVNSSGEAEHKKVDFAPLVEAMAVHGTEPLIDTLMYIMFGDTFLADPHCANERDHWREKMLKLPKAIADSAHEVVFRQPMLGELQGCRVPVLAIAGAEDHAYGPKEAENIATASGGKFHVVEKAGHSTSLEQHQVLNGLLRSHFANL